MVEGQRRPGLAWRRRNAPRQRGYVLAGRQARTAIGMGKDRRTGRGKGGVAIGVIEMPVRIDNPLRHSPEHAGDSVFNLRNAGTIARVNDRSSRRSRNRRQVAPGARKDENTEADLRRQERRGLVGCPGLSDQAARRKAVLGEGIAAGRVVPSRSEIVIEHGRLPHLNCRISIGTGGSPKLSSPSKVASASRWRSHDRLITSDTAGMSRGSHCCASHFPACRRSRLVLGCGGGARRHPAGGLAASQRA